jgi:glycosyltransferase involved in cell wall biosynthesis
LYEANANKEIHQHDTKSRDSYSEKGPRFVPKVSVLSPTFRHAAYISECIESVLAQSEQDWEMIVVDDGSDDGTADIADSYRDPRIVVIRRAHQGVAGLGGAYAAALEQATSPLIAILEGDDTWPVGKIERQLTFFDDKNVVLSYGSAGLIDENGCLYSRFWNMPRGRVARNDPVGSILPALVRRDFIVASTVVIRRSTLEQIGGFFQPDGVPYVDLPTWLRLATRGSFSRSPHVLGNWRRHSTQVTTQSWFDSGGDRTQFLREFATAYQSLIGPELYESLDDAIREDSGRQQEESLIAQGRIALLDGQWQSARSLFTGVFREGSRQMRPAAAMGLVCTGLRIDMERLIGALGRHSLPSRRRRGLHSSSGSRS